MNPVLVNSDGRVNVLDGAVVVGTECAPCGCGGTVCQPSFAPSCCGPDRWPPDYPWACYVDEQAYNALDDDDAIAVVSNISATATVDSFSQGCVPLRFYHEWVGPASVTIRKSDVIEANCDRIIAFVSVPGAFVVGPPSGSPLFPADGSVLVTISSRARVSNAFGGQFVAGTGHVAQVRIARGNALSGGLLAGGGVVFERIYTSIEDGEEVLDFPEIYSTAFSTSLGAASGLGAIEEPTFLSFALDSNDECRLCCWTMNVIGEEVTAPANVPDCGSGTANVSSTCTLSLVNGVYGRCKPFQGVSPCCEIPDIVCGRANDDDPILYRTTLTTTQTIRLALAGDDDDPNVSVAVQNLIIPGTVNLIFDPFKDTGPTVFTETASNTVSPCLPLGGSHPTVERMSPVAGIDALGPYVVFGREQMQVVPDSDPDANRVGLQWNWTTDLKKRRGDGIEGFPDFALLSVRVRFVYDATTGFYTPQGSSLQDGPTFDSSWLSNVGGFLEATELSGPCITRLRTRFAAPLPSGLLIAGEPRITLGYDTIVETTNLATCPQARSGGCSGCGAEFGL